MNLSIAEFAMSDAVSYVGEPNTTGKVIVHTSIGDIDVELWCTEAKRTCRAFITTALSGGYDNTTFSRISRNYVAQLENTPACTIAGDPYSIEKHSRLRFNRRGMVALSPDAVTKMHTSCAWFVTLGSTPQLQNTCSIFGKVTGITVHNLSILNDTSVDDNEQPYHSIRITSVTVLNHPFNDVIVTKCSIPSIQDSRDNKRRYGALLRKLDSKVLSFEDSESYSDFPKSKRLSSTSFGDQTATPAMPTVETPHNNTQIHQELVVTENSERIIHPITADNDDGTKTNSSKSVIYENRDIIESESKKMMQQLISYISPTSVTLHEPSQVLHSSLPSMSTVENHRQKWISKHKNSNISREENTLARLQEFKTKLRSVNDYKDELSNSDKLGWLSHRIKFERRPTDFEAEIDAGQEGNTFFVIDPRKET